MEDKLEIFEKIIICCVIIALIGLGIFYYLNRLEYNYNFEKDFTEEDVINTCSNLDLKQTSYCLNSAVKEIYNFSLTYYEVRNLSQLKILGGDCYDYTQFYKYIFDELNFSTEVVILYSENHTFMIASSREGYCLMEQNLEPKCNYLAYE